MNFDTLTIDNFLTVGNARVELRERGLLLIQGVNEDDPSTVSNGAGKSSIVDALCWALYGVTARGVTGDLVVNRTAKKNCQVAVVLLDGDFEYRIVRHRKHDTGKNMVTVSQRCCLTGAGADISKGTDKETQDVINKVMGCSLEVFMAAVYSGQEAMPDLPGMTDKMLKVLIEEAAGVEVLTQAYAVARARHSTAGSELARAEATNALAVTSLKSCEAELGEAEDAAVYFDASRKDRARVELAKIMPVNAQIKEQETKLGTYDEAAIAEELALIVKRLEGQKAEQTKLDTLNAVSQRLEQNCARLETQLDAVKLKIKKAEIAVTAVDSQVGKACGECGKTYHADDLCDVKGLREDSVTQAIRDLAPVEASIDMESKRLKVAEREAAGFKTSMTDVSLSIGRQRTLLLSQSEAAAIATSITTMKHEVRRHAESAKTKLGEVNLWREIAEKRATTVAAGKVCQYAASQTVTTCKEAFDLLTDAVAVFGPAGVRAHILDTVTPFLNDRTREYLGTLTDGNIHATWSTLSKTAKGELREKFNIEVSNAKGAESFAGLSGGEKRKVRLATAMALQDMVASRATKPIGLWVGDEIDGALDEAGLERLMGILEIKAKERGTVLVISHHSLTDWIDNIITVTKKDGYASVSGENIRH